VITCRLQSIDAIPVRPALEHMGFSIFPVLHLFKLKLPGAFSKIWVTDFDGFKISKPGYPVSHMLHVTLVWRRVCCME